MKTEVLVAMLGTLMQQVSDERYGVLRNARDTLLARHQAKQAPLSLQEQCLARHSRIEAVKLYRERTDASILAAKVVVDAYLAELIIP